MSRKRCRTQRRHVATMDDNTDSHCGRCYAKLCFLQFCPSQLLLALPSVQITACDSILNDCARIVASSSLALKRRIPHALNMHYLSSSSREVKRFQGDITRLSETLGPFASYTSCFKTSHELIRTPDASRAARRLPAEPPEPSTQRASGKFRPPSQIPTTTPLRVL